MRMTMLALALGLSAGSVVVNAGEPVSGTTPGVDARPADGAGQAEAADTLEAAATAAGDTTGETDAAFLEPRALGMVSPTYPNDAVDAELTGSVVVCFSVSDSGVVGDVHVLSSTHELFEGPAVTAATQSRFEPARRNGIAVAHDMCLRYRFRL